MLWKWKSWETCDYQLPWTRLFGLQWMQSGGFESRQLQQTTIPVLRSELADLIGNSARLLDESWLQSEYARRHAWLNCIHKLDHLGCTNNMLENLILPPSVSTLICSTNNLSELDITSCPELMKSGDEDSFCVGKQRKNKVLTLHLTSQQNRYWLRTYSETDENTNSNILS